MKNIPEFLHRGTVCIPSGSSNGTHIPEYLNMLPSIKFIWLTVLDISILKTLGTQRKSYFLHPAIPCDSFQLSTTHRV